MYVYVNIHIYVYIHIDIMYMYTCTIAYTYIYVYILSLLSCSESVVGRNCKKNLFFYNHFFTNDTHSPEVAHFLIFL